MFLLVLLSLLALANLYVYRRFFLQLDARFHLGGRWLMGIIMTGELLFALDRRLGLLPESTLIYTLVSSFIGATLMLLVVALLYDLLLSVSHRLPFDQERRRLIKIGFDIAALLAATSYLWRGYVQGSRFPEVNDVLVQIRGFPFHGFTIVQWSDVHIGHTLKRPFLQQLVERSNGLRPDLVVITGDLLDLPAERIRHDLEPLSALQAPVYFVTGNHEYFHGVEAALELLRQLGVRPLTNQAVRLGRTGAYFNLLGLNDLAGARFGVQAPDVQAAYRGLDEALPTIVLAHQPKTIELLVGRRCDLMLSGHTHGGQIFPFGALVKLDQPYLAGLHEHRPGQQIFVSRGTGYWGPPLRVLAPSEISRIVISAGKSAAVSAKPG